jgi:RNA polymerase sigma-70 factor (ECF subfamily)
MSHNEIFNDQVLQSLKERIAEGDERSFRQLFDNFSPKLIEFAYAMLKLKDAATEVVDQVFVKIWQQRKKVTSVQSLRVYLYTATKNTALNYISKKAKEQITEPFDFINLQLSDNESPEQQMITSEIFKKIRLTVDELPPRCKMIFKLVREDGLKYKEVAEILNISLNTVDAQMVIAVKRISEKLKSDFEWAPRSTSKKV